jgi:hypothetical protein
MMINKPPIMINSRFDKVISEFSDHGAVVMEF